MKNRKIAAAAIVLLVLILCFLLLVPGAPLLLQFGIKPFCLQGDFPSLKMVSCPDLNDSPLYITPFPTVTPGTDSPIPLIFDDDGSPDGMLALLFFIQNPQYELKAVTISAGEAHPGRFAPLARQFLASVGSADIPVGAGREIPLQGSNAFPEPWRNSSDSFWDIPQPEMTSPSTPLPAARLMVNTIQDSLQPVVVFVSGTHTNLAEALRLDPSIKQNIAAVYIMGGSIYQEGNIGSDWPDIQNSVAEWNIWVDPLAASEVFRSGLPLHLMPLDATNQVLWEASEAQGWAEAGGPAARMAANMLNWMLSTWSTEYVYIWDLSAAVALTDSRLCDLEPVYLEVETEPGSEQGRTRPGNQPANVHACLEPNAAQIKALANTILTR